MRHPKAVPRPWTLDFIEGGGWAVVVDADGDGAKVIAELDDTYGDRAANAALIVEAVNIHAALAAERTAPLDVERLRRALLDLAGLDYTYDARLDSGDYGNLERPREFAVRILARLAQDRSGEPHSD